MSEEGDGSDPDIEHVVMEAYTEDKFKLLLGLLAEPVEGGTLVFGRTKWGVRNLGQRLQNAGHQVAVLQGNLDQNARDRAMEQFRSGPRTDSGGDERGRARAGHPPYRKGDQLRTAGDPRAVHTPGWAAPAGWAGPGAPSRW